MSSPHYNSMVVYLRNLVDEWQMVAIVDGEIASQTVFKAERDVAIQRAEVLASWFDADLVLEKVDS